VGYVIIGAICLGCFIINAGSFIKGTFVFPMDFIFYVVCVVFLVMAMACFYKAAEALMRERDEDK